uniref:L-lysine 2,3-aminomutase n=1 Tax=Candidatus Kentrum sp. TUN TaxID=2126343 RepID=A0A450ZCI3_9GAMM|nr:MAG: L-lysine 2,3-aminomutase [Candidatus Kentron sp. TUN]VFK51492.1 MAG: L-lysine 2,3-aminomutase [Candidatus Kentron sp. TUN]VFK59654.1 MAG: L-lysine 2,3-aminomutase [Candidatus Kentron sp. TUN]
MLAALGLTPAQLPEQSPTESSHGKPPSETNMGRFPLLAPRGYVARMQRRNPRDPLLRQVLPVSEENIIHPGYAKDPLGECHALRAPGVLQKYKGRVLLTTTTACAIHCRYCFRRHFSYGNRHKGEDTHGEGMWDRNFGMALAYIRENDTIREVILSGGDPLCLSDERLAALANGIADISHVQRLRIHTRLPIALPERVDDALLTWLTGTRLQTLMVIHANHPNEIDEGVENALALLRIAGITLLNQSVLLRGVNDHGDTLVALNERLFAAGVLPYYLHMLDPVEGAAHFAVEQQQAKEIMIELRSRLPGYLVPRLVREEAGARYKIPVEHEISGYYILY